MASTDAISLSPKIKRHKQYTLVIPLDLRRDRVLLGYKLRGFGQGNSTRLAKAWWSTQGRRHAVSLRGAGYLQKPHNHYNEEKGEEGRRPFCIFSLDIDNGYGGKVEPNETIIAAAIRELHEESGLLVEEPAMIQRGVLMLETVADETSPILEIHVFTVETWEGTETSTDEMTPHWFSLSKSLVTPTQSTSASGSIPPSFLSASAAAAAAATSQPHPSSGGGEGGRGTHDLPAIPYFQMWEESRVWLPQLLRHVSSGKLEGYEGLISSSSEGSAPDVDGNKETENNDKQKGYFIHHVQFIGGTDMDAVDGGEYSVWHGMGLRRLDWVDELPVEEWEGKKSFGTYP